MIDAEHAKSVITDFLLVNKDQVDREMDFALREIALLSFFGQWKARRIACKALGIGAFWNYGFEIRPTWRTRWRRFWGL